VKRVQGGKNGRLKLPATLRLGRSGLHGHGLFARVPIARGARIIEYVGNRITKAEAEREEERRLKRLAAGEDGCVYIFELNKRHDIDGRVPWNPARRINHSCAPNCEVEVFRGRIWITAVRDLQAGEELTYDYSFDYDAWRDHPCRCGAEECPGFIVAKAQRWRVRRIVEKEGGR
jgi:SET domain-containing protein